MVMVGGKQDYKKFLKFYNENSTKLHMEKKANYPINYERGVKWANSHCDNNSIEFANKIIKYTRHVPYDEYYNQLKKVCLSYIKTYQNNKNDKFVLILPFNIKKSNTWVSLLAMEYIKDIIDGVYYNITEVYNNTKKNGSDLFNKKVHCIICDDCSYTGNQLYNIAYLDATTLEYSGKELQPNVHNISWINWYDKNYIKANSAIKKINMNDFSVDILVPYMSILAQERLSKINYLKIPKDCVAFPIFTQQVNVGNIPLHILNEFTQTFQYHNEISAIYFDHKVADYVSTFNKVYLFAPIFGCNVSKNIGIGFIENCSTSETHTIPKRIDINSIHVDMEKEGYDVCPSSFYKKIKYTFNNEDIADNIIFSDLFNT
jgi:hypothetical protein